MNLLRGLIGIVFGIGFFLVLFVLAWYIVLPLILIFSLIALCVAIRNKFLDKKFNTSTMSVSFRKKSKKDKVIDVDYTEV